MPSDSCGSSGSGCRGESALPDMCQVGPTQDHQVTPDAQPSSWKPQPSPRTGRGPPPAASRRRASPRPCAVHRVRGAVQRVHRRVHAHRGQTPTNVRYLGEPPPTAVPRWRGDGTRTAPGRRGSLPPAPTPSAAGRLGDVAGVARGELAQRDILPAAGQHPPGVPVEPKGLAEHPQVARSTALRGCANRPVRRRPPAYSSPQPRQRGSLPSRLPARPHAPVMPVVRGGRPPVAGLTTAPLGITMARLPWIFRRRAADVTFFALR